jgi:leader peptidase (prepilin peptidase) / N-methyltransferase
VNNLPPEIATLFVVTIGAILGSFFNLLIHRLPKNENIVYKRSHCPSCNHPLGVLDLIPILSFIFLKGRCRYCKKGIAPRYPIVEIISAFIFWICYINFGLDYLFFKYALFLSCLLVIFFTDLETYIIPNVITYPLILIGIGLGVFEHNIADHLWGTLVGFMIFFVIAVLAKLYYKKDAMGGGDMKLGAAIGAFWGVKLAILSIYFGFFLGGITGFFLIAIKVKKRTDHIPFGPAIILGTCIALVWGELIWNIYIG